MIQPDNGLIDSCSHQECGYACCDFGANNYIALYPGEIAEAIDRGQSLSHLDYVADGRGGHRAVCRAKDRSDCDGGYKPLDCSSYPLFPVVGETGILELGLKGEKCPLQHFHLRDHGAWVLRKWRELLETVPMLGEWIRRTDLVGYITWSESPEVASAHALSKDPDDALVKECSSESS